MNIFICDDNRDILDYIDSILKRRLSNYNIYTYSKYEDLVKDINDIKVDILIMDIVLNNKNGIDVVKENIDKFSNTQIIYITAFDDYIEECFETNLIYVLRKPIVEDKLMKAIDKAICNIRDVNKSIIVKVGKDNRKINIKDINYIESEGRLIKFNLSEEIITVYGKISDVEDDLGLMFVRIHKSYLVNMDRIVNYTINKIELKNGKSLPISRSFSKSSKEIIFNYLKDSE